MIDSEQDQRYAVAQEQLPLVSISIKELVTERQRFNISPEYQRKAVWGLAKKRGLIHTILGGDPIIPLEGYRTIDKSGETLYEINDGGQRIRTIIDYFDGKFKTWTAEEKKRARPNSGPPIAPGCTFEELPAQEKGLFYRYWLYINCPRNRDRRGKRDRFFDVNAGEPLTTAERLNADVSKAKDAAQEIELHPFWKGYGGNNKRMQLLQSSLHLVALQLAYPLIMATVSEERYLFNLAGGVYDARVTETLVHTIQSNLNKMLLLYDGVHFTRRSLIIPMYQSILLLEEQMGWTCSPKDKGKLTPWIMTIAEQAKRQTTMPSYNVPVQLLLREATQKQFWDLHLKTIISLVQ